MTQLQRRMIGLGTFLALGTLAVGAFQGCSPNRPSRNNGDEAVGSVGLALQLGPGQTLNTVAYTITGPNNFTKTGTLDVSHSNTVSGTIGGIPAGNGYTIALNGTTTNGGTTCLGSAMFNIAAAQTTMVTRASDLPRGADHRQRVGERHAQHLPANRQPVGQPGRGDRRRLDRAVGERPRHRRGSLAARPTRGPRRRARSPTRPLRRPASPAPRRGRRR